MPPEDTKTQRTVASVGHMASGILPNGPSQAVDAVATVIDSDAEKRERKAVVAELAMELEITPDELLARSSKLCDYVNNVSVAGDLAETGTTAGGSLVGGLATGAAAGAALGTGILPGAGTLVGTGIGVGASIVGGMGGAAAISPVSNLVGEAVGSAKNPRDAQCINDILGLCRKRKTGKLSENEAFLAMIGTLPSVYAPERAEVDKQLANVPAGDEAALTAARKANEWRVSHVADTIDPKHLGVRSSRRMAKLFNEKGKGGVSPAVLLLDDPQSYLMGKPFKLPPMPSRHSMEHDGEHPHPSVNIMPPHADMDVHHHHDFGDTNPDYFVPQNVRLDRDGFVPNNTPPRPATSGKKGFLGFGKK